MLPAALWMITSSTSQRIAESSLRSPNFSAKAVLQTGSSLCSRMNGTESCVRVSKISSARRLFPPVSTRSASAADEELSVALVLEELLLDELVPSVTTNPTLISLELLASARLRPSKTPRSKNAVQLSIAMRCSCGSACHLSPRPFFCVCVSRAGIRVF